MNQNLTNTFVKKVVEGVRNKRFMYAVGGIYENILIYTTNGCTMYRVEVKSDLVDYVRKIKQPENDFEALTKIFTGMNKYIRSSFFYDDMHMLKHNGQDLLHYKHDGNNYYFDPKYLTKFKNDKKYELNLWVFSDQYGIIVNEYYPDDDIYDQVALVMGVKVT